MRRPAGHRAMKGSPAARRHAAASLLERIRARPARVPPEALPLHRAFLVLVLHLLLASPAAAAVGLIELPRDDHSGRVVVLYPTEAKATGATRGPFRLQVAIDGPPGRANGHLVVVSHGSPASPWVHFDLASALVAAGYVVALPVHEGDNADESGDSGMESWKRRPREISAAIDRLQRDVRFQGRLDFENVGMYGMSAGGLTALVLAGGAWSPANLQSHCERFIREDFHACAGPTFSLSGGMLDDVKISLVQMVNRRKWADATRYSHVDGRIRAIVAGVPLAAHFDPASLREPRAALALVSARKDRWLVPRFHSDAVLSACRTCVHLIDLAEGGHGALLSPLPPGAADAASLIADPPGFDRASEVPRVHAAITGWFDRHLLAAR